MQSSSTQSLPSLTTMVANHRSTSLPLKLITLTYYLHRFSSRILMRNSVLGVLEIATEYVEQRQTACWPVIVLVLIFNFVSFAAWICIMSLNEVTHVHLRVWIVGYAIKYGVRGFCVYLECKRRLDGGRVLNAESSEGMRNENMWNENSGSERDGEDVQNLVPENGVQVHRDEQIRSVAKHLDTADAMLSFIWWIIGFYWVYTGGQKLTHDSPQLYWLCITFLVFDAFIIVICVAAACVVGLAVCFCLPFVLEILNPVTDQEEGIQDCIQRLPKYKFHKTSRGSQNEDIIFPCGKMIESNTDMPTEHALPLEDAVCCICLCVYEDGNVLCRLPCHHHFHSACIVRWLYRNPTCPLCKTNIFNFLGNNVYI